MKVLHISIDDGNFAVVGVNGHVVITNIRAMGGTVDTLAVARNIAKALDASVRELTMDEPRSSAWTFESVLTTASKQA